MPANTKYPVVLSCIASMEDFQVKIIGRSFDKPQSIISLRLDGDLARYLRFEGDIEQTTSAANLEFERLPKSQPYDMGLWL